MRSMDRGPLSQLIIGSNAIRPMIQRLRSDEKYWELVCSSTSDPELPDMVGTVRLQQAVTLARQ